MKWTKAAERRVEEYLGEVEKHMGHKPESVRGEVKAGLSEHVAELARRAAGDGEIGLEAVERILGEMDPPESYAEAGEELVAGAVAAGASKGGGVGGRHWFGLALAFFALNALGVWRWTQARPPAPAAAENAGVREAEPERPAERRVLRLRKVEQVDVTPERELTLKFAFSDRPDREQATRFLKLSAPGQGEVAYRLSGAFGGEGLLVRTEPVLGEKLEYEVLAGMPSSGDSQPMDGGARGSLKMEMNLQLRGMEAESPSFDPPRILVDFNALPEGGAAKDYVLVEPATEFRAEVVSEWYEERLKLEGDFEPGGIYEVTLKEGLPAANGSSLPKEVRRTVHFPKRRKAVRLDVPGRYLAPQGTLSVPVAAANMDRYEARISRVYPNNLVQLALRESGQSSFYGQAVEHLTGEARAITNGLAQTADGSPARGAVDLRALAGGEPRGAYWLSVGGEGAAGDERLLVATDLGLAARVDRGGVLAWVNGLGTAEPVAGAAVAVYARNNQVLARGTTGEDGLVRLEVPEGGEDPFVVVAEFGSDWTYVDLERMGVAPGEGTGGARYLEPGKIEAAVFTDRGIYRPGETLFAQAIARDDQMRAPEPFPALLRVRRPDGRIYRDVPVELDGAGSARAEIGLPEYLPTGRYGIELAMPRTHTVLGSAQVALEDFVPPQIRVAVEAPGGRFRAGDVLEFGVLGEHLFGRAASGLKATAAATFSPAPFAPTNWAGWEFGDANRDFAPIHRSVGAGRLDGEGRGKFNVDSRKAWRPPAALKAVLACTVVESSGRAVTAYGSATVDAYPFYVGMKRSWEGSLRAGETQRVSLVEVDPGGEGVAKGKPLALALSRVTWNSVLRRNSRGRYEWKSERQAVEIMKDTVQAGGEPTEWAWAVDGPGDDELVASDPASGASTRLAFGATSSDPAWASWSREKPGRVELALDRERYRPGDVAKLQIRAPFAGRALLALETDRIREVRALVLEKNTAEIEIAVEEAYAPNVHCSLTLIRPARAEATWSAHRASGSVPLRVDRPNRALRAEIAAPATARPRAALEGEVAVVDEDGLPAKGFATVFAVDEAICMLTDHQTPDPGKTFAAQRALGVAAYDLYADLMPISEDEPETTPSAGGDGEDAIRKRLNPIKANRFRPLALWKASLPLDEGGRAKFRMELPEFSGELRLMAVAYNETQTGSAEKRTQVRRDLVVQPALPRFLAIGDECLGALALHNAGDKPIAAKVRATCGGPLRTEYAGGEVEIPAGGGARIELPLVAGPGPGKAICTIEAEAGEESYRETIELAVRPAAGSRVATAVRTLGPGESAAFEAPPGWLRESASVSVALAATPSLEMGRALDYVANYPYGCLEQTTSGAFPLLYAGDWIERMPPGSRAAGDAEGMVAAAISRVLSMQQDGGGFATWPFATGVAEDDTLYALHFLVEAKAAGHEVPEEPLGAALGWARRRLDAPISPSLSEEDWRREMGRRSYACMILARAGTPDAGWAARLREQAGRLDYAGRVQTATALLLGGEPRQAVELMEAMPFPAMRPRKPGRLLDSAVRDAALLLSAWMDVDPGNEAAGALAQGLAAMRRDGHWGNTHDNAMALVAFGKMARSLPAEEQPFSGAVEMPDGSAIEFGATNAAAWSTPPGAGGGARVRNDGPGKAYVWVRHEGVSAEPEPPMAEGASIEREYLDAAGERIGDAPLEQGELIVVKLTVDTMGNALDQLVVEDLLPAGLEIENPHLATSRQVEWLRAQGEGDRHREARDDRMLIFTGAINGRATYHYAARATTPGTYALPPPTVSGMYEPEIRGVGTGGRLVVEP